MLIIKKNCLAGSCSMSIMYFLALGAAFPCHFCNIFTLRQPFQIDIMNFSQHTLYLYVGGCKVQKIFNLRTTEKRLSTHAYSGKKCFFVLFFYLLVITQRKATKPLRTKGYGIRGNTGNIYKTKYIRYSRE